MIALVESPRRLTETERRVFALIMDGYTDAEIAVALRVSVNTAKNHVKSIREKLGGSGESNRWWVKVGRMLGRQEAGK